MSSPGFLRLRMNSTLWNIWNIWNIDIMISHNGKPNSKDEQNLQAVKWNTIPAGKDQKIVWIINVLHLDRSYEEGKQDILNL